MEDFTDDGVERIFFLQERKLSLDLFFFFFFGTSLFSDDTLGGVQS